MNQAVNQIIVQKTQKPNKMNQPTKQNQGISTTRKAAQGLSTMELGWWEQAGEESSLYLYSLLEILVPKFPKGHQSKAWL